MAKVLLAEDDNNLREIYEARLQAEGYETVVARDGEEALVVAKKELPDLVISDVMMPKISGFEMLDILRNTDGIKNVKVIMLTALGQADDQTRADSLGADRYLVKSQVTLEDIVNAAHELLNPSEGAAAPAAAPAATTPIEPSLAPAPVEVAAEDHMSTDTALEPVLPPHTVADLPEMPLAEPPAEAAVLPEPVVPQMPPTPATTIPITDDNADDDTSVAPVDPVTPAPVADSSALAAAPTAAAEKAAFTGQVMDFLNTPTPAANPAPAPAPAATSTPTPAPIAFAPATPSSTPAADSTSAAAPAPAPASPTDTKGDFDPDSVAL